MKECISLYEDEYEGELRFSVVESEIGEKTLTMTLGAKDGEELVGFKIEIPIVTRRVLFKNFQMLLPSGTLKFFSIGEMSDRFIKTMERVYNPGYPVTNGFSSEPVEIDYTLRNQGDFHQDKIYLKLYYDETQDEDLPQNERIHLKMNFAFNLSRETASLIETEDGFSADLAAFLMK